MGTPTCASCSVTLAGAEDVYAPLCGHVFHKDCLFNILACNPKRCTECNAKCAESHLIRLYLPFPNERRVSQEANLDVDSVDFLQEMQTEINAAKQDFLEYDKMLEDFRKEQQKIRLLSNLNQLKDKHKQKLSELKILKPQKKTAEKLVNELNAYYVVEKILAGSSSDMDEVLQRNLSPDILAKILVTLRSKTKSTDDQRKEFRAVFRENQSESEEMKSNISQLQENVEILETGNNNLRCELLRSNTDMDLEQ